MPAIMMVGGLAVVVLAGNAGCSRRRQARRRAAVPGSPPGATGIPRRFGLLLLAEAVTLGIASYLHRNGHIPLTRFS
jgi:hypothetical protein